MDGSWCPTNTLIHTYEVYRRCRKLLGRHVKQWAQDMGGLARDDDRLGFTCTLLKQPSDAAISTYWSMSRSKVRNKAAEKRATIQIGT